jgi:phosphoglycolate phosphatase
VVRNVIFDLDGTLVDSLPGIQWSVEAAMKECGVSRLCPNLKLLIGPPVRTILAVAAATNESVELDRLEQAFRKIYDVAGWRRTLCQPDTRTMLDRLQLAGCVLWIATNKPAHATHLILPELAIAHYFSDIVCRDSRTPPFSSKAEMLRDLLLRQSLSRDAGIFVGDTMEDCEAASAAGLACAVVPHGYGKGMDGRLPEGCRRIAGWDELVEWCTAGSGESCPRQSALMMGEGEG